MAISFRLLSFGLATFFTEDPFPNPRFFPLHSDDNSSLFTFLTQIADNALQKHTHLGMRVAHAPGQCHPTKRCCWRSSWYRSSW